RLAGGSWWMTAPSPLTPAGRRWLTITPISVTPSVAPIERENWLSAVAEPDARDDHRLRGVGVGRVDPEPPEHQLAEPEHDRPDQRVRPVAPRPRDDLAGEEAGRDRAEQKRRQHHARRGRRRSDHALHEQRHI